MPCRHTARDPGSRFRGGGVPGTARSREQAPPSRPGDSVSGAHRASQPPPNPPPCDRQSRARPDRRPPRAARDRRLVLAHHAVEDGPMKGRAPDVVSRVRVSTRRKPRERFRAVATFGRAHQRAVGFDVAHDGPEHLGDLRIVDSVAAQLPRDSRRLFQPSFHRLRGQSLRPALRLDRVASRACQVGAGHQPEDSRAGGISPLSRRAGIGSGRVSPASPAPRRG